MISKEEVLHIAKLAKLRLEAEEAERFTKELSDILDFVSLLQEVPTDNVEETSQVTGLSTVTREDIIAPYEKEKALLECSPHPIEDNAIVIPKIV